MGNPNWAKGGSGLGRRNHRPPGSDTNTVLRIPEPRRHLFSRPRPDITALNHILHRHLNVHLSASSPSSDNSFDDNSFYPPLASVENDESSSGLEPGST